MGKTVKMRCPVPGCKFIGSDEGGWKEHFQRMHPAQKELNIGGTVIKLQE